MQYQAVGGWRWSEAEGEQHALVNLTRSQAVSNGTSVTPCQVLGDSAGGTSAGTPSIQSFHIISTFSFSRLIAITNENVGGNEKIAMAARTLARWVVDISRSYVSRELSNVEAHGDERHPPRPHALKRLSHQKSFLPRNLLPSHVGSSVGCPPVAEIPWYPVNRHPRSFPVTGHGICNGSTNGGREPTGRRFHGKESSTLDSIRELG